MKYPVCPGIAWWLQGARARTEQMGPTADGVDRPGFERGLLASRTQTRSVFP